MAEAPDPSPDPPSPFLRAVLGSVREACARDPALDLACGRGRHAWLLASEGIPVLAVDRDRAALDALAERRTGLGPRASLLQTHRADLEADEPPVLPGERFGAVLVFRYLHRPRMAWIASLLAPGGLLVYETFTRAQRELGWGPRRDAFLLEAGELPRLLPGLEVLRFEEGPSDEARPAQTARLLARRPD